nr:MAG TPA: mRNA capping enzyme [Caudoviricetes sp.]DAM69375.1 MAG TPA: mRNA capping enzyme [Caudoviricetes sp.]
MSCLKTLFSFYIFFFFRKVLSGKKAKHKRNLY